jgi:hypothetical protein
VEILADRDHPLIAREFRKIIRKLVEDRGKYLDSRTFGYIGYYSIPIIAEYLMKYENLYQGLLEDCTFLFERAVHSKNGENIIIALTEPIFQLVKTHENPKPIIDALTLNAREFLNY